jgi:MtaA/CmuA family methyltransferase
MTGKELVLAAIRCEAVEREPWVPFVGCHAARLLDISAEEYLKSEANIVAGVQKGIDLYKPDGVPVVFDLQIEAEILGCSMMWSPDNPPAVASHPLADGATLDQLTIPGPEEGRLKIALAATRRLREANPDIALYGLITGPFTLALHLQGTDIFLQMFDDPDRVQQLVDFCRRVGRAMADAYLDAGVDVVAVVDPMTSQIGPHQFEQFVTPHLKSIFDHIRDRKSLSSLFVCGHAQKNIEVMCNTRPDNISIDENIALDYVRDICLPRKISFGGNLQLTTVLLLGTPRDAQRHALECLKIGGKRGFILSPGCDLPYATPPANLESVTKLVHDPYEREVVETLVKTEVPADTLDMSDYGNSDKVIVDIITLDSEGCAPCQYMVEAVKSVAPQFEGIVEWREHKIKHPEALTYMGAFFVKNIPTICIDGRIAFVSQIPARNQLIEAVQNRIFEKLRTKIQQHRGVIYLIGDAEDGAYQRLKDNTVQAMVELGADIDVELREVTDNARFSEFGVMPEQTPVTITAKFSMKSAGKDVPTPIIKEWLKGLT